MLTRSRQIPLPDISQTDITEPRGLFTLVTFGIGDNEELLTFDYTDDNATRGQSLIQVILGRPDQIFRGLWSWDVSL